MARREKTPAQVEVQQEIGEFGQQTEWIPRSAIHVLPQIRTVFDPIKLQELASSIKQIDTELEHGGNPRYDLLEPLTEGRHDEMSAQRYLRQYNQINGTSFRLADFSPTETPRGPRWYFHIAGERRYLAGGIIIERDNLSPDSLFQCAIKENIEYTEALPLQFVENNARVNPPPQDEAAAIRKYYDAMKKLMERQTDEKGRPRRFTHTQCAEAFSVSPDKISDAITFTDYPPAMQKLLDRYPYSTLVAAKDLYLAWVKHHTDAQKNLSEEEWDGFISLTGRIDFKSVEEVAAYEVETCFIRIKAEKLKKRRDPSYIMPDISLPALVDHVKALGMQGELFSLAISDEDDKEAAYLKRRKLAVASLFHAAVEALSLLDRANLLTNDMRQRIGVLATVDSVFDEQLASVATQ